MEVEITNVNKDKKECYIQFVSQIGHGKGLWKGKPPNIFGKYHVEIEIDDHLTWGQNIKEAKIANYRIELKDGTTWLRGKIESLFEDGIIGFQLDDSLLLLEVEGKIPEQIKYVEISVHNLSLFDINL